MKCKEMIITINKIYMNFLQIKRYFLNLLEKLIFFFSFPLENPLLQYWHLKKRSWIKGCLPRYLVDKIIN